MRGSTAPRNPDARTIPQGTRENPMGSELLRRSAEALRALYGRDAVSVITDRRGIAAVRVRVGEQNIVLNPSQALARLRRENFASHYKTRRLASSRGIMDGALVSQADASPLPLRDDCGIPNCPNDHKGFRHADRSEQASKRDAALVLRSVVSRPPANRGKSDAVSHPRGSRNSEVRAQELRDAVVIYCAHGNLPDTCPECAR